MSKWLLAGFLLSALGACDDEGETTAQRGMGAAAVSASTAGPGDKKGSGSDGSVSTPNYRASDFTESETSRDPFRPFVAVFKPKEVASPQRAVIMPETTIEEMRLIAVISGTNNPSAMLVDRMGVGHTVRRGDYVGRPEVVQEVGPSGDAISYTLNWRVDRIRSGEIVLSRSNPTTPDSRPLFRVVPLFQEGEQVTGKIK